MSRLIYLVDLPWRDQLFSFEHFRQWVALQGTSWVRNFTQNLLGPIARERAMNFGGYPRPRSRETECKLAALAHSSEQTNNSAMLI
jgi:hypothetical protein